VSESISETHKKIDEWDKTQRSMNKEEIERITARICEMLTAEFRARAVEGRYNYDAHCYYKFYPGEGFCSEEDYPRVLESYEKNILSWCREKNYNLDCVSGKHKYHGIDHIYVEINWILDS
jgi:hypothetical protein